MLFVIVSIILFIKEESIFLTLYPIVFILIQFLKRFQIKKATSTDSYKNELIRKNVHAAKISVIPNGIEPEVFYPRYPEKRVRGLCGLSDEFVCSFVGTIGMASGLDDLPLVIRTFDLGGDKLPRSGCELLFAAISAANKKRLPLWTLCLQRAWRVGG